MLIAEYLLLCLDDESGKPRIGSSRRSLAAAGMLVRFEATVLAIEEEAAPAAAGATAAVSA